MQIQYNKLDSQEIRDMLTYCWNLDKDHIIGVHETGDKGLDYSINHTLSNLTKYNVKVFEMVYNNEFIGFFGEESLNSGKWLTLFFIHPDFRTKDSKSHIWKTICNHFNGNFKAGVYSKNVPYKKFLMNNNCNFDFHVLDLELDLPCEVYKFVEGVI